ncbi:hypothetical protein [Helicobacter sp. 12S02634-8]|uniref:hypothetical protein n=1 Tax=Helicobacter sp. 12S02634-8 TaxID=1476199 RepID=UPI00209BDAD3|nr:hypothetical protein [Helicobacter sp. 12S02634-8]
MPKVSLPTFIPNPTKFMGVLELENPNIGSTKEALKPMGIDDVEFSHMQTSRVISNLSANKSQSSEEKKSNIGDLEGFALFAAGLASAPELPEAS